MVMAGVHVWWGVGCMWLFLEQECSAMQYKGTLVCV